MNLLVFPKYSICDSKTRQRTCTPDGHLGVHHGTSRRILGHATVDNSYQQGLANRASSLRERTEQC